MASQISSTEQDGFEDWTYTYTGTNTRPVAREFVPESEPESARAYKPPMTEPTEPNAIAKHMRFLEEAKTTKEPVLTREWAGSVSHKIFPPISRYREKAAECQLTIFGGQTAKWPIREKRILWLHMHRRNFYGSEKDIEPGWMDECLEIFGESTSQWTHRHKEALKKRIRAQIAHSSQEWVKGGLIELEQSKGRYRKTPEFQSHWDVFVKDDLPFQSLGGGKAMNTRQSVDNEIIEVPDDEEEEDREDSDYFPSSTARVRRRREPTSTSKPPAIAQAQESPSSSHLASPPLTGSKRRATEGDETRGGPNASKRSKTATMNYPIFNRASTTRRTSTQRGQIPSLSNETSSRRDKGKAPERPDDHDSDDDDLSDAGKFPPLEEVIDTFSVGPASPGTLVNEPRGFLPNSGETDSIGPPLNNQQPYERGATETRVNEQLVNEMQTNESRNSNARGATPPRTSPPYERPTPSHYHPQPCLMIQIWHPSGSHLEFSQNPYNIDELISKRRTQSAESFFTWYESESRAIEKIRSLQFVFPGQQDDIHKWEIGRDDESKFRRMGAVIWILKRLAVAQDEEFVVLVEPLRSGHDIL